MEPGACIKASQVRKCQQADTFYCKYWNESGTILIKYLRELQKWRYIIEETV